MVNGGYGSHTGNNDNLSLLIKSGNTHIGCMILQTVIGIFEACKEEGETQSKIMAAPAWR